MARKTELPLRSAEPIPTSESGVEPKLIVVTRKSDSRIVFTFMAHGTISLACDGQYEVTHVHKKG